MAPSTEEQVREKAEAVSYQYTFVSAVAREYPTLDAKAARAAAIDRIVAALTGDEADPTIVRNRERLLSGMSAQRLQACLEALGLPAVDAYKATVPGVYDVDPDFAMAVRSVLTGQNRRLATSIVGHSDADDVLQIVAIRIGGMAARRGFTACPPPRALTAKAIRNECISRVRARKAAADIGDPMIANLLTTEMVLDIAEVNSATDQRVDILVACGAVRAKVAEADRVLDARIAAGLISPGRERAIRAGLRARIVNILTGLPLKEGAEFPVHAALTHPELEKAGLGELRIEGVTPETLRVNVAYRYRDDIDSILLEVGLS